MTFATPQDFRFVESVVEKARSSFGMGMKALPQSKRGYLFGIYAYCRVLDDIADSDLSRDSKTKHLDQWKIKVDELIAGRPTCEITRILTDAIDKFNLPTDEFYMLIDGMRVDALGPVVQPSWDELYDYCRKVAVSVGLLSLPIFGRDDEGAREFGIELGYALQLTNILRDVEEDYAIGRTYLPSDEMTRYEVKDIHSDNLHNVLEAVAEKVRYHYSRADELLGEIGKIDLLPAMMMKEAYHTIFKKMERRGWYKISPRMRLSTTEKAFLVMKMLTRNG